MDKFSEKPFEDNDIMEQTDFTEPPELKVVFYNDNVTTMDFVVEVLVSIFNKSHDDAVKLMYKVHENDSAVVGIYAYDIAISLSDLAKTAARQNGFPLRVEVE